MSEPGVQPALSRSPRNAASVRAARINQDMTGSGSDQVAVHPPHAQGQWEREDVDVVRHVGRPASLVSDLDHRRANQS